MEGDQARLIEPWAQVSPGKHEGNGDPPPAAPVEDEPLAFLEDLAGDPV